MAASEKTARATALLERLSPWLILVIAVGVRLALWREWRAWPGSGVALLDARWHLGFAARVLAGDLDGTDATWAVAPGLGFLYALAGALGGGGTGPPALLLLGLDLGMVEVIRRLAARAAGPWAGLVGGGTAALAPNLPFHALTLLGVSPPGLLLGLSALLALRGGRGSTLLGGLCLGSSCWFRPNQLLLLPLLALVAAWPEGAPLPDRRRWPAAARTALGVALALAPGLVRNLAVSGDAVPISANAGANLYMAHAPGSWDVQSTPPPGPNNLDAMVAWFQGTAEARVGHALSPGQADAWWMGQARARIAQDPVGTAQRALGRFYVALATWSQQDHYAYAAHRRDQSLLGGLPDPSWLLPGLAWVGARLLWRGGRRREAALLAGLVLGMAASLAPFSVVERYRLPGWAALVPCAATGLVLGLRQPRALLAAPLVSLLLSGDPFQSRLVLPDLLARPPALSWSEHEGRGREVAEASNLGAELARDGQVAAAGEFYRKVLEIDPDDAEAHLALAALLAQEAQVDAALAELDPLLAAHPRQPVALLTRCGILLQAGRPAVDACQAAAEAAPGAWQPWVQLAVARLDTADPAGASEALGRALAIEPELPGRQRLQEAIGAAASKVPPATAPAGIGN